MKHKQGGMGGGESFMICMSTHNQVWKEKCKRKGAI